MRIIKSISSLNHVKLILDKLKPVEEYISQELDGNSSEYERTCNKIGEQFSVIDEFILDLENINPHNISNSILRQYCYWDYIQNKLDFDVLIRELKRYS